MLQRRRQRWRVLLVFAVNVCAEGMLVDDCSKGSCTCLLLFVVIVFVYPTMGLIDSLPVPFLKEEKRKCEKEVARPCQKLR